MNNVRNKLRWGTLIPRATLALILAFGLSWQAPLAFAGDEDAAQQPAQQSLSDGAATAASSMEPGQPTGSDEDASGMATGQDASSVQDPGKGSAPDTKPSDETPAPSAEEAPETSMEDVASEDEEGALPSQAETGKTVEEVVARMTLEEKISQMIIVALRSYDGTNVTDLSEFDALRDALQKHQYGGVILFGQNISSAAQTAQLVHDLQENNAGIDGVSKHIPYFTAVDEEGGLVIRFLTGTRMTGSMAVGATGANAQANALATGQVLGEECAALGFNVDFAPDADVNVNPLNPVIGTRSFSDDPTLVATLATAFAQGMGESNVVATYKHFPGHGDTGTDTHVGVAAVNKTIDELRACELVPFKQAIEGGADMIMTAHITLPQYDDEQTLADGSKGYYPATMSRKVITDLLRRELSFDGVVVTDALEMGAIGSQLVPGAQGSVENHANIAEKCINAGVDLLLIPTDITGADAAAFYDGYIEAIAAKVGDTIPQDRIDESVTRILKLKEKYGIFAPKVDDPSFKLDTAAAVATVGSDEHHATEMRIAREAITLLKNEGYTLPLSGHEGNVVIVSRMNTENHLIASSLEELKSKGALAEDALINNLATGETAGSADSKMKVTLDYYVDTSVSPNTLHYTDELKAAVAEADVVVGLTENTGIAALQPTSVQYMGESRLLADTHKAGGKFVMLSNNLPYDVARHQDSDAILLSYMASGYKYDPTQREVGNTPAYNANLIAAIQTLFDNEPPQGTLPVTVPEVKEASDGSVSYDVETTLYERGTGLHYDYAFLEGEGGTHRLGTKDGLAFKNNARHDRLQSVLVDGTAIELKDGTVSAGSTNIWLDADTLNTMSVGKHTLTATYSYDAPAGATEVSTTFNIVPAAEDDSKGTKDQSGSGGSDSNAKDTNDNSSSGESRGKDDKPGSGGSDNANPRARTRRLGPRAAAQRRPGQPTRRRMRASNWLYAQRHSSPWAP